MTQSANVRDAARMRRRRASREARRREIEGSPEQMNRAGLSQEAAPKLLEHGIHLDERPEEAVRPVGVVDADARVSIEEHELRDLDGHRVERQRDAEALEPAQVLVVEVGQRPLVEAHRFRRRRRLVRATRRRIDEVELDVEHVRSPMRAWVRS